MNAGVTIAKNWLPVNFFRSAPNPKLRRRKKKTTDKIFAMLQTYEYLILISWLFFSGSISG